ncbi:MAG: AgmX/PglI C-terminal domain-containing protein [Bdellovibrionota bacterium]
MKLFSFLFVITSLATAGCATPATLQPTEARIDKEAIRRKIRENRKAFHGCYDEALERNPTTKGKIELAWEIGDDGKTSRIETKYNSTGDEDFGKCMAKSLEKVKFEAPPKGQIAKVIFPFIFTDEARETKKK